MIEQRSKHYGSPSAKFAILLLMTLDTPAWRALSTAAQALYPWLVMEFKGKKYNNNGKIRLSVRQAALKMGTSKDTVARAFGDLQAKGFIKVTKGGSLGISGMGKCPEYEIAAITLPENGTKANKYYEDWKDSSDFKVFKHPVKNGKGKNKSLS
jgi:DNA-binding transcriptional MocR family regulator